MNSANVGMNRIGNSAKCPNGSSEWAKSDLFSDIFGLQIEFQAFIALFRESEPECPIPASWFGR